MYVSLTLSLLSPYFPTKLQGKKKKKTQTPMRGFQLNRDKKSIRGHTTTIRRECLSKLLQHATKSARGSQGGT